MTRPTHTERIATLEKDKAALWRELCAVARAVERARTDAAKTKASLTRAGRHADAARVDHELRRTLHRLTVEERRLDLAYGRATHALTDARRAAQQAARR